MSKNKNQTRYGVFYISNGNWVGPYAGKTFTKFSATRSPIKEDIQHIRNNVLKSKIELRPVKS